MRGSRLPSARMRSTARGSNPKLSATSSTDRPAFTSATNASRWLTSSGCKHPRCPADYGRLTWVTRELAHQLNDSGAETIIIYGGSTPVLARYALAATHAPGTTLWPRPDPDPDLAARTCRSHASADAAQIAFIAKGGPEADPARMDPDGDGFVCGWNPEPWRQGRRP